MTQLTQYLTLEEAAAVLRSNPRTIRRYIRDGKISFVRIGRKYLFRDSDLLNLPSTQKGTRK